MEFITIIASSHLALTMVAFSLTAIIFGAWGAYALTVLDSLHEVGNYSMQQDLAYPQVRNNEAWEALVQDLIDGTEQVEDDRLTMARMEELFYGYTMDSLEEALEVVSLLVSKDNDVARCWEQLLGMKITTTEAPVLGYLNSGVPFSWILTQENSDYDIDEVYENFQHMSVSMR